MEYLSYVINQFQNPNQVLDFIRSLPDWRTYLTPDRLNKFLTTITLEGRWTTPISTLQELLEMGATDINGGLREASRVGNWDLVNFFLSKGARPEEGYIGGVTGDNPD